MEIWHKSSIIAAHYLEKSRYKIYRYSSDKISAERFDQMKSDIAN